MKESGKNVRTRLALLKRVLELAISKAPRGYGGGREIDRHLFQETPWFFQYQSV